MGYDGKEIGNRIQGLLSPIVAKLMVKNKGLGFGGIEVRP
jgi:hypothetical protein